MSAHICTCLLPARLSLIREPFPRGSDGPERLCPRVQPQAPRRRDPSCHRAGQALSPEPGRPVVAAPAASREQRHLLPASGTSRQRTHVWPWTDFGEGPGHGTILRTSWGCRAPQWQRLERGSWSEPGKFSPKLETPLLIWMGKLRPESGSEETHSLPQEEGAWQPTNGVFSSNASFCSMSE